MKIERVKVISGEFIKTLAETPEDEAKLRSELSDEQKVMLESLERRTIGKVSVTGKYSDIVTKEVKK